MLLAIFSSDRRDGFKEGKAEWAQSAQRAAGRAGDAAGDGPAPRVPARGLLGQELWGTGGGKRGDTTLRFGGPPALFLFQTSFQNSVLPLFSVPQREARSPESPRTS